MENEQVARDILSRDLGIAFERFANNIKGVKADFVVNWHEQRGQDVTVLILEPECKIIIKP